MGIPDMESEITRYLGTLTDTDDGDNLREAQAGLQKLLGPLQLRSEQDADHITVSTDMVAQEIAANVNYIAEFTLKGASSSERS